MLHAWASLDALLLALYCAAAGAPRAALRAVSVPDPARAILEVGGEYAVGARLEEGAWWMLAAVLAHWGLHAYVLRCAREHAPGDGAAALPARAPRAAPLRYGRSKSWFCAPRRESPRPMAPPPPPPGGPVDS